MTKVELYFSSYPTSNQCFETSDGLLFHEKPMAETHGATLKDKKVIPHSRVISEAVQEGKALVAVAAELIASFEQAESVDALKALLPEGEKRKGVLAAYEKRMDALAGGQ